VDAEDAQSGVDLREARTAAMNYLARREHGCRELENKLLRRGIPAGIAAEVVEQLRAENLLSDERYAEAYVRSRFNRLVGPLKVRAELRQRGVTDACIEPAMEGYADQWQAAADAWAGKRADTELDRRQEARIYRSGTQRGFTHEQMMRALNRLKSAG
jgi:regulatory protein